MRSLAVAGFSPAAVALGCLLITAARQLGRAAAVATTGAAAAGTVLAVDFRGFLPYASRMHHCQRIANDHRRDQVSTSDAVVSKTPPAPCRRVWLDADGHRHRLVAPAVMQGDDHREWWVHGRHVTAEVEAWLLDNHITWPFTAEQQAEFALRWG